nr:MAG TPA: hypothetical protein [Caudoviricetes sp.]
MFDYTKETILNSVTDKNVQAITGLLRIFRVGEYKVDYKSTNIADGKVYKAKGTEGTKATATITAVAGNSGSNGGKYRVTVNMKNNSKFYADYATAVWKFQKPIYAEFTVVGDSTDNTAALMATKIANAIKLALPENNKYITVTVDDDDVIITATDATDMFESVVIEKYEPNSVLPSEGQYVVSTVVGTIAKTDNEVPFATGDWLIENLRFPSYPNTRYNSINGDEKPVPGQLYTQYSFRYIAERKNLSGIGSVGQRLVSITNHVFYIPSTLEATFEAKLKTAFGEDVMAKEKIIEIIGNDSIAKGSTVTLMANAYNVEGGEVAPVDITWSLPNGNDSGNLVLTGDQLEVKSSATGSSVKVKATATGFTEATKTITLTGK